MECVNIKLKNNGLIYIQNIDILYINCKEIYSFWPAVAVPPPSSSFLSVMYLVLYFKYFA